jgi:hypothetical protein
MNELCATCGDLSFNTRPIRLDFEVGFCIPYLFQTLLMSRWGVFIRSMEDVESEHQIYGQR